MYQHAIIGGTFDHLHIGHKLLIDTAFIHARKVTVCITTPEMTLHKKFSESIEGFETRKQSVTSYLAEKGRTNVLLTTTPDIYGTSLTDETLDAIVVTDETKKNALHINEKRKEKGWPELIIITVPLLSADDGKVISSERIREGIIDREGHSYEKFFLRKESYVLPDNLREVLQKPVGQIVSSAQAVIPFMKNATEIITVGDIVSMSLKELHLHPAIAIIDYRSKREDLDKTKILKHLPTTHFTLENQPGTINPEITMLYKKAQIAYRKIRETQVILAKGEEDLLGLAIMLLAPLDALVLYGLHPQGIVVVVVTERIKLFAKDLLSQF